MLAISLIAVLVALLGLMSWAHVERFTSESGTILERGIRRAMQATNSIIHRCLQPSLVPCDDAAIASRAKGTLQSRFPGLDWNTASPTASDTAHDSCKFEITDANGASLLGKGVDVSMRFDWDPSRCDTKCCKNGFWPAS
jgi:hypothetical protein